MKIDRKKVVDFTQAKMFSEILSDMKLEYLCDLKYEYDGDNDRLYLVIVGGEIEQIDDFERVSEESVVYPAPELDELREWFVQHGYVVNVEYKKHGTYICCVYFTDRMGTELGLTLKTFDNEIIKFPSYYEALSAGISEVLRIKMS